MEKEDSFEMIFRRFPEEYRHCIDILTDEEKEKLEEVRVKAEGYLVFAGGFGEKASDIKVSQRGLTLIVEKLLDHSVYAHMEELCSGYITVEGGHRIGICGRVVMDNGSIKHIKEFSSINIRKGREVIGCSRSIQRFLLDEKDDFLNTLVISPPKCGKTTLLRDIVRTLSEKGKRVSVVDERSELCAVYKGVPQYDVGRRTDVLDGCKKSKGMSLMIRSMSPELICTDEIGSEEDVAVIKEAVSSGVGVLTSIHGMSLEELRTSKIGQLIEEKVFERYLFLSAAPKIGTVTEVLDKYGRRIDA
ncbi:MAG: stage III sporulation protein AA [Firmicutes bacterium]|nr:stage III sporulation protein AA [Bacillota bacterium]